MPNRTALFNRTQPGGVFTVQDMLDHPGDIWFVDSGAANGADSVGAGRNPDIPFLTLDYAIGQCTANNGDTILVMPGHTEDLDADSAVDVDVAGLKIIGLGDGAARPTFDASAAAGDFKLAAASIVIINLLFTSGVDATTGMLEISGADCQVLGCEFRDVTGQATDCILTVNGSDRLLIADCRFNMAAGAGANSAIALDGSDDVEIRDCSIYGNFAVGAIDLRTTLSARVWLHRLKIWTANAADIAVVDTITSSTGQIGPDITIMLTDNAANITTAITGATFHLMDPVYVCNLVNEKGMLINWTASVDEA